MSEKHPHPHFDDGGTLDWQTSFGAAVEKARAEGKHLFIEIGRELWGNCRSLVQAILPRPDVAPLVQEGFVALAADADLPEPQVHELMFKLKNAMMLPFVILADVDGNYLDGSSGAVTPEGLLAMLQGARG